MYAEKHTIHCLIFVIAFHPWVASGVPPPMWVPVLVCVGGEYSSLCSLRTISLWQFLPVLEGSKVPPPLHSCGHLHVASSSESLAVCHPAVGSAGGLPPPAWESSGLLTGGLPPNPQNMKVYYVKFNFLSKYTICK